MGAGGRRENKEYVKNGCGEEEQSGVKANNAKERKT